MMRVLVANLILFFTGYYSYAQNSYTLSGTVVDSKIKPISFGDAFILSSKDSILIKYSNISDGKFSFDPIKKGEYILKISCLGFVKEFRAVILDEDKNLPIVLKESEVLMREVKVSGSKKIFTLKGGNIKVNIENSIFTSIPNPVDLLSKLPTIQVNPANELISVIGKGEALIYIDNQKASIDELKSLSVNDIKNVEIINNPSAKYEAEGRAVILITRKINKKEGLKIDLTQTSSFKTFYNSRTGISLSYKRKRVELKSSFQYNNLNLWESNGNSFLIGNKNIQSDYIVKSIGRRRQYILGAGAYFQINEDDYFSLNVNARFQNEPFTIKTNSSLRQNTSETEVVTTNLNESPRVFLNSNFNYNKRLKKINGQLFFGGQYSKYNRELNSNIWNNYDHTQTVLSQDRAQKYSIDVWSGRVDFEKVFKGELKWEAGANITRADANAILKIQNYPQSNSISDYDYLEGNYAVYTQLTRKLEKASWSAGLRIENTQVEGGFKNAGALLVDKNYTQLFPKANVDIPIDSTKTLTLGYARSIKRPNYSSASQIITYINPFFEWANNINLNPSISDEISATLQYKENSLQLTYYRQKDPVYYGIEYNDQENKLKMINKNFDLESGIYLSITLPFKYKIWNSTNVLSTTVNRIKDPSAILNKSKPYFYIYSNNQFKLPKDYAFVISGWGLSKRYEGIFERSALITVDLGVSKTFYKKLNCTLNFNDIFKSLNAEEKFTINNIKSNGIYYEDVREFSISLKYSLGIIKDSKYKSKEVNENADRIK
jgi:hypothetical protein